MFSVFIFLLIPATSAFAYSSEGLLKGLPVYYTTGTVNLASGTYSTASEAPTRQVWTDGIPDNGNNLGNNGHMAVRLESPATVRSIVAHVTNNAPIVKLYDSDLNVLSTQNFSANEASQRDIPKVTGVKYVELYFSSSAGGFLRELNIFSESACGCDIQEPTDLTATDGNSYVTLNWTTVEGATGYNVKRSTVSNGPYTTVANNVYGTSFNDTDVVNGTTYYYVVTALKDGEESENSNEASATPQGAVTPPDEGNNALLVITLVSGLEKEYDLPMSQVNDFISWYNGRAAGTGAEVYTINKSFNKANFLSRKDYIAFSKIETFEVNEYTPEP
jgi:hypothetical protein